MATERLVKTKFWTDNYITTLDPIEKLLFLYIITNPLTNISGIYELPLKQMSFDTGIESDMIRKIFDRFERDGKVFYRNGWIGIANFIKNQHVESSSVKQGIAREIDNAPEEIKTATFGVNYREGGGRVGGGWYILNLTKLNLTKPNGLPNIDNTIRHYSKKIKEVKGDSFTPLVNEKKCRRLWEENIKGKFTPHQVQKMINFYLKSDEMESKRKKCGLELSNCLTTHTINKWQENTTL